MTKHEKFTLLRATVSGKMVRTYRTFALRDLAAYQDTLNAHAEEGYELAWQNVYLDAKGSPVFLASMEKWVEVREAGHEPTDGARDDTDGGYPKDLAGDGTGGDAPGGC